MENNEKKTKIEKNCEENEKIIIGNDNEKSKNEEEIKPIKKKIKTKLKMKFKSQKTIKKI